MINLVMLPDSPNDPPPNPPNQLREGEVGGGKIPDVNLDSNKYNLSKAHLKSLQVRNLITKDLNTKGRKKSKFGMGSAFGLYKLDIEKKRLFLTLLEKNWPNISETCRQIGICNQTYYTHRAKDPEFAKAVEAIRQARLDKIEQVAVTQAENPKAFLDRAMILRAHRPELYDRAKTIRVEGYRISDGEAEAKRRALAGAVDAEIVQSYKSKRDRKATQKALGEGRSGDGTGGDAGTEKK